VNADADSLRRQYLAWRDSPGGQVAMPLFVRFAREMLARRRRFGVKLLVERVRWEVGVTIPADAEGFRLNNNWAPNIARDLIEELPALADYIETRRVADEDSAGRRRSNDAEPVPAWVLE
jgi:hypothetical protein